MGLKQQKTILVTGAHRSGSTWVGRIIASSPKVRYVHEPFNIIRSHIRPPFKLWFQFLNKESDSYFQKEVSDYLNLFVSSTPTAVMKTTPNVKNPKRFLAEYRSRWLRRTLLKDPIALMSAPWIHQNLNSDVIIVIRHPAAFVASIKVKDWNFEFHNFLEQKDLLNAYLDDYKQEIENATINQPDIVEQGILLWNCFYAMVLQYKKIYNDKWYFVTHESLSNDPIDEYKKLFLFLKLDWNAAVESQILKTTTSNQVTEHTRDSRQNIRTWQQRLTPEEIQRIKSKTSDIWKHFYSENDWIINDKN